MTDDRKLAAWLAWWLDPIDPGPDYEGPAEPTDDDLWLDALIDRFDAGGPFAAGVPIPAITAERGRR